MADHVEVSEQPSSGCRTTIAEITMVNPTLDKKSVPDDMNVSFVPIPTVSAGTGVVDTIATRKASEVKKGCTPFRESDVLFAKTVAGAPHRALVGRPLYRRQATPTARAAAPRPPSRACNSSCASPATAANASSTSGLFFPPSTGTFCSRFGKRVSRASRLTSRRAPGSTRWPAPSCCNRPSIRRPLPAAGATCSHKCHRTNRSTTPGPVSACPLAASPASSLPTCITMWMTSCCWAITPPPLNRQRLAIEAFLRERRGLALHPDKTVLQRCNQGIDFLGVPSWAASSTPITAQSASAAFAGSRSGRWTFWAIRQQTAPGP